MVIQTLFLAACCLGQTKIEPVHAGNPVFTQVLEQGVEVGGQKVKLPSPRFVDGQTAEEESAALERWLDPTGLSMRCCDR